MASRTMCTRMCCVLICCVRVFMCYVLICVKIEPLSRLLCKSVKGDGTVCSKRCVCREHQNAFSLCHRSACVNRMYCVLTCVLCVLILRQMCPYMCHVCPHMRHMCPYTNTTLLSYLQHAHEGLRPSLPPPPPPSPSLSLSRMPGERTSADPSADCQ